MLQRHIAILAYLMESFSIVNQGRKAANSLGGKNKLLNDAQEQAILQYIDRRDQLGRPCDHRRIELAANSVLRAAGTL